MYIYHTVHCDTFKDKKVQVTIVPPSFNQVYTQTLTHEYSANSRSASPGVSYFDVQDGSQIPGCSLGSDPHVWILELRQDHAASSSVPAPGLVFYYYTSLLLPR
jgi:hypothetical protein